VHRERRAGYVRLSLIALLALSAGAQELAPREFEKRGFEAWKQHDYATCARVFAEAAPRYAPEPAPAFLAARCYARLHDDAQARRYLDLALDRGFRNCKALEEFPDARARCEANDEAFVRASNRELLAAYLADQALRGGEIGDLDAAKRQDAAHRVVARAAIAQHALRTADDYFHAAMILQHGSTPESYAEARELARKAVDLRPSFGQARWLYAAATDRWLQATGKPQIYGTQYRQKDGKWTLEPFDPSAVTDAQRAEWRVPSLADRLQFIEEINRQ
jgi:tetratricopeptide (TPR) repeat protein